MICWKYIVIPKHFIYQDIHPSKIVIRYCMVEIFCMIASENCVFPHRHKILDNNKSFENISLPYKKKQPHFCTRLLTKEAHPTLFYICDNDIWESQWNTSLWDKEVTVVCTVDSLQSGHSYRSQFFHLSLGWSPFLIRYGFIYPLVACSGFGISRWKSKKKNRQCVKKCFQYL